MTNEQLKIEIKKNKENIPYSIIPGVPIQTAKIIENGYELMALYSILDNNHEIVGDSVARREVLARITVIKTLLKSRLERHYAYLNG